VRKSFDRGFLDQGRRPAAYSSYIGSSPVSFTAEEAESAALAHVLGIVREPTEWFRPTMALARPLLQATLSMVAAAIHASKKTLQAAHPPGAACPSAYSSPPRPEKPQPRLR
jgi:hypothetical protein